MAVVEGLAIVVIFTAGMIGGVIVLVSVAVRREDRRRRLGVRAPGKFTAAGRDLTSLYVRRLEADQDPDEDQAAEESAGPDWPSRPVR